jgi:hypothetical protein
VQIEGREEERRRTSKQVTNALHVDLHVRNLDEVLEVGGGGHDGSEDLLRQTGDDTLHLEVVDVGALEEEAVRIR